MLKAKDYLLGGDDRAEWDRAWRSMPHRRLTIATFADLCGDIAARLGAAVSATVALDSPEFSDRGHRESETCPICGRPTIGSDRLGTTVYPTWANGLSVGTGVWVHRICFEGCPVADELAPIPW